MTIDLRVEHGAITFPESLCPPDGTVVRVTLPEHQRPAKNEKPFQLRTFKGDGLRPGIDLSDPETVWGVLDADGGYAQPH